MTYRYNRQLVPSVGWIPVVDVLTAAVKEAIVAKPFSIYAAEEDINIDFVDALTPDEVVTLDTTVAEQTAAAALDLAKSNKFAAIDAKTTLLINRGFVFANLAFSLSQSAQSTLLGLEQIKDDPALVYPINYNTIDDSSYLALVNAAMVHGMFMTAVGTYRYWLDSGTALKNQVRAATTVAEVEAIVDNRGA